MLHKSSLGSIAAVALWFGSAHAAPVGGSYAGIVDTDSGLGLIGQTMRVDFVYDDAATGSASGSATFYDDFLESLSVTIGPHVWVWQSASGSQFAFLNNDDDISTPIGVEDRIYASAGTFVGPNLPAETVDANSYTFSLRLSDTVPTGMPDGLSDDTTLPTTAPDPDAFSGPGTNEMEFRFFTGHPEFGGTFYRIATANVTTIPVPAALWLLGPIVAGLPLLGRRRR